MLIHFSDPPPQRGDRREYRPDMDRRRYEENRRQEYEYPRTGPPAAPYRSGDSAHSMPYRDLGARGYDYTAGFRESPVSYPMADVAQRYGRDPVDRYMTDSYRPPAAYEPGAALSPALSRYDNRYDIMDGPRRVVADPYSAPGRAAYNPAEARYGAEYRGRDYSDVRSMGVDYAAYAAGRRSRSRSREKYPEPIPAYNRVARAPSGYSGDAYRADRYFFSSFEQVFTPDPYADPYRGREGGYGSLIDGPLPPHSSTGYGVPPPSRDAPYASKAYPADDREYVL